MKITPHMIYYKLAHINKLSSTILFHGEIQKKNKKIYTQSLFLTPRCEINRIFYTHTLKYFVFLFLSLVGVYTRY